MNEVIRKEDSIKALREMAQQLLDLLVLADTAQVAEAEARIGSTGITDLPESCIYGHAALLAPKWIRDELDWEIFSAFLRPR